MDQLPLGAGADTVQVAGSLQFVVHGTPAPQGSKKGFYNKHTNRVQMVESSAKVKPWRDSVRVAALDARETHGHSTFAGPVRVVINFTLLRPKGHFGTGRNAGNVKASAPAYPATRPDLDKLQRSTLDALKEAGVYRDDGQVVTLAVSKGYPGPGEDPGATITVSPL